MPAFETELNDALGLLEVHEVVVGPLVSDVGDADLARLVVVAGAAQRLRRLRRRL